MTTRKASHFTSVLVNQPEHSQPKLMIYKQTQRIAQETNKKSTELPIIVIMDQDMSAERLSLISFTSSLGNSMTFAKGDDDLHPEARLLMNLSCSNATDRTPILQQKSRTWPSDTKTNDIQSEARLLMNLCSTRRTSANETSNGKNYAPSVKTESSFFFSCPSLSLDESSTSSKEMKGASTLPSVSLSRPLTVYDADAIHLSANAMSCNIIHTFQRAIDWRKRCWNESIVASLVAEEQKLKGCGKSEEEIKSSILKTPAALVFDSLDRSRIEVKDARISFRVLPHQWSTSIDRHISKKQKIGNGCDNTYTKTYVLSMKVVLNFNLASTPSEVTLDVPGTIDGFFSNYDKELCGIAIDIDTQVLANMVEKSTRLIVRSAVEAAMPIMRTNLTTEEPSKSSINLQTTQASETLHATVSQTSSPVQKSVTVSPTLSEEFRHYPGDVKKLEIPVLGDERSGFLRAVSPELR